MTSILDTALELHAAGYSVVPIRPDASKAPAGYWKQYTERAATREQINAWFTGDQFDGLGIITGTVSGNLEMCELEGRAAHHLPQLRDLAHDSGLGDLWDLVTQGWAEITPSGGFHFYYRLDGTVPGNTKIAKGADKQVLAETRGEGGMSITAPSAGRTHPTGKPWTRLAGGPDNAPLLTLDQRDDLHTLIATIGAVDETPATPTTVAPVAPHNPTQGITPGDDYENRTDWTDILAPHGWTLVFTRGHTRYWRRPGKNHGLSATTGNANDRDRLYVFTSSTEFATEIPYTKLGALAVLEHGGNHETAAKALYTQGFGERAKQPRQIAASPDTFFNDILGPTNGDTPWTTTPTPTPTSSTSATATDATTAPDTSPAAPATSTGTNSQQASSVTEPEFYTETDDGNALRLIDTHHQTIRYCPQRGSWLTWDGHRWQWDETGHVQELSRTIARDLPEDDKEAERHRKNSLSRRGIEAMTALARTDPRTATHLATLDARPYELNTPSGIINLRTGQISPPNPEALHTRSTTLAPDFTTTPTRWLDFLADTFAGDPDLITYMQRLTGVSLVGTVLEQVLPFAHGVGANGKTTFAGVLQRILGLGDNGYSISAPAEMLLATQNQGHPTEIARLAGARLVVTSELEDDQRFAEARIKQLTGSDPISGRFMRQDWFTFTPTHTLWLLANHLPGVKAGGPAFWRRIRMLPFEHTVPVDKRVAGLETILVDTEGPAILAWAITGARDYFQAGLGEPDSVRAATDAYAADQDTVGRFVDDMCETGDPNAQHLHVKTTALRGAYETWCRTEGETPVSAKALTQQLRARYGVIANRTSSTRFYDGIRLNDVSPDPDDEPTEPSWQQQEGW